MFSQRGGVLVLDLNQVIVFFSNKCSYDTIRYPYLCAFKS